MVGIGARPANAPWTVVVTRDGDEVLVDKVTVFGAAQTWPFWVEAGYRTVKMEKNALGKSCDEQLLP